MNGYWKFHRQMVEHPVWSLPHARIIVWLTILNHASHKDAEWFDGKNRVQIPAGSFITSQDHLSKKAKTTRQVVRDTLQDLYRLGCIERTNIRTNHWTMISVTNWHVYQGTESEENQPKNHAKNQPRTNREPTENHIGRRREGKKKDLPSTDAPGLPLGREEKKTMTAHQAVIESFLWTFEKLYGSRPAISTWEAASAKSLASGRTSVEAAWIVNDYLSNPLQAVDGKLKTSLRDILNFSATILARTSPPRRLVPPELLDRIGVTNGKDIESLRSEHS